MVRRLSEKDARVRELNARLRDVLKGGDAKVGFYVERRGCSQSSFSLVVREFAYDDGANFHLSCRLVALSHLV